MVYILLRATQRSNPSLPSVNVHRQNYNWTSPNRLQSTWIFSSVCQIRTAWSMALMDKHKQVKRQRLDRICEGKAFNFIIIVIFYQLTL